MMFIFQNFKFIFLTKELSIKTFMMRKDYYFYFL